MDKRHVPAYIKTNTILETTLFNDMRVIEWSKCQSECIYIISLLTPARVILVRLFANVRSTSRFIARRLGSCYKGLQQTRLV